MTWFPYLALAVSVGALWWVVVQGRKQRRTMSALDETYKLLAQMAERSEWNVEKKDRTIHVTKDAAVIEGVEVCILCKRELLSGEIPPYCADCEMGH